LAAVPGGQRLSHSITITEASGASAGWSATSDAAWLRVTPSGFIGGSLLLSADPSSLADGAYLATVTVRSSGNSAVSDESVRVGFFKSSVAPAARLADPLLGWIFWGTQLVSDPVRPLVYVAFGGTIAAQHFHTGARVGTITLPSVSVTSLAVSDDGRILYVLNGDGSNVGITLIDLATFQVSGQLPPSNALQVRAARRMTFSRVAGQPVLVLNQASDAAEATRFTPIINAESGALVGTVSGFYGRDYTEFEVARGGVIYSAEKGLTGGGFITSRIQLRANSRLVYATMTQTPLANGALPLIDFAVHPEGRKVIQTYYGTSNFMQAEFNGTSLVWTDSGPPNPGLAASNVEFLTDGRYATVSGDTLRLYALDGTVQFQWVRPTSGPTPFDGDAGSIRISSDGLRLLGNSLFVDLPPR
jgi:hypothetical protein